MADNDSAAAAHPALKYLAALDEGDFELAAAQFALDARYFVPAAPGSPQGANCWLERFGRAQIRRHFDERGRLPLHHNVRGIYSEGRTTTLVGTVALENGRTAIFTSLAALSPEGLLASYVALSATLADEDVASLIVGLSLRVDGR